VGHDGQGQESLVLSKRPDGFGAACLMSRGCRGIVCCFKRARAWS